MDTSPIQTAVVSPVHEYMPWLFGFLGSVTRVCLVRGRGKPLNNYEIVATLISGTVFAGTGGTVAGMAGMGATTIGLSAYFAGIFGMVVAEAVFIRTTGDKQ